MMYSDVVIQLRIITLTSRHDIGQKVIKMLHFYIIKDR